MNRPTSLAKSLPQPLLEFRRAGLADDYSLRRGHRKVDGEPAAKPHGDVADGFAGDDELAVGTEELHIGE